MSPVPSQKSPDSLSGPPEAAPDIDSASTRPKHTVGALLRETRESCGGDIERIANALRIRAQYLVAIEEGRYGRLPAPVYALGFVRAYAIHLGLDGEEAVRRFKQEASGFEISRDLVFPVPLSDRGIPHGRILAAAVLLLLAAYGSWYYLSSGGRIRPERVSPVPKSLLQPSPPLPASPITSSSGAPPASARALATPSPSVPTSTAATSLVPETSTSRLAAPAEKPTAEPNPQVAPVVRPLPGVAPLPPPHTEVSPQTQTAALPGTDSSKAPGRGNTNIFGVTTGPVRIVIRARADCWVKVSGQDGTVVFEHLLKAGDVYRVPDQSGLQLEAGNASGLAVLVDGEAVPPLTGGVRHDIRLDPVLLKAGTAVVD